MTVTQEDLAAYADGELDAARAAEVEAAVAADPALAEAVRRHHALKDRLVAHFAPILDQPVPERLAAALQPGPVVIDFAQAKARRTHKLVRWSWMAGPALAASLALAIFLQRDTGYADGRLSGTLDEQLVASQAPSAETRVLLSFRNQAGAYCRAFVDRSESGIACRDDRGWRLVLRGKGSSAPQGDYRMAGTPAAEVLERAQDMAVGPALDAAGEQQAQSRGWR